MKDNDTHWLQTFFTSNLTWIIMLLGGAIIFYANITSRVQAVEEHVHINANRIDTMQILVERVIVLEERENSLQADIIEIKEDIKEIKQLVR